MVRRSAFSLFLAVAVLLAAVSVRAEIPITQVYSITVPDNLHVKGYQGLIDVDADGFGDLCFRSSSQISAFSIVKNELIACLQFDQDGHNRKFDCGFIDGDSLLDFAEAVFIRDSTQLKLQIVTRFGSNVHAPLDTIIVASFQDEHNRSLDSLFLRDLDGDRQPELCGRHVYGVFLEPYNYQPGYWEYYYQTFAYYFSSGSFTLTHDIPVNLPLRYDIDGTGQLAAIWTESTRWYVPAHHGSGSDDQRGFLIYVARDDNSILKTGFSNLDGPGCPPLTSYASTLLSASQKQLLLGDFLVDSPGWEALLEIEDYAWLGDIDTSCSDRSRRIVYLDLSSPDALPIIRVIERYEGLDIGPGFADEAYPNSLLMFGNGYLYAVDAVDLLATDSSGQLIEGYEFLDYVSMESGGQKYAIMRTNWNFWLYALDLATEAPEAPPESLPETFVLDQPYPNPFNPALTVPLKLPRNARLLVEVYNSLGQRVETLYDDVASKGELILSWDAERFSSGVYLVRASTDSGVRTAKVMLLK